MQLTICWGALYVTACIKKQAHLNPVSNPMAYLSLKRKKKRYNGWCWAVSPLTSLPPKAEIEWWDKMRYCCTPTVERLRGTTLAAWLAAGVLVPGTTVSNGWPPYVFPRALRVINFHFFFFSFFLYHWALSHTHRSLCGRMQIWLPSEVQAGEALSVDCIRRFRSSEK